MRGAIEKRGGIQICPLDKSGTHDVMIAASIHDALTPPTVTDKHSSNLIQYLLVLRERTIVRGRGEIIGIQPQFVVYRLPSGGIEVRHFGIRASADSSVGLK